jgi:hypothetical protein
MRAAVEAGFDPFSTRLVDETTIDHWSEGHYGEIYGSPGPAANRDFSPAYATALRKWRMDLVMKDATPWRFCRSCAAAIRGHTSVQRLPSRSVAEIAGERAVRAMVFGEGQPAKKWWEFWK